MRPGGLAVALNRHWRHFVSPGDIVSFLINGGVLSLLVSIVVAALHTDTARSSKLLMCGRKSNTGALSYTTED